MAASPDIEWLTARPIAHRGLHDPRKGVAENSLAAFRAAVAAGYAIECDIRLTRDRVPVVFHDAALQRMAGVAGLVHETDAATLRGLELSGTQDTIPTLADLLSLVDGQVGLVVEMKGVDPARDAGFADIMRPLLDRYAGPLALMSFDDWLIDEALRVSEHVPVGLTAEGTRPALLDRHRAIFGERCHFTSYNVHHLDNAFVRWVREEMGRPVISWTVRDPEEQAVSRRHADQITFEGYEPQP